MHEGDTTNEGVTADELVAILHAVAQSPDVRIRPVEANGQRVWIKHYDLEPLALAKRLHSFVSPVLFPALLRAPAPAFGAGGVARESAKIAAFRAAGFGAPVILHQSGSMMILSDLGTSLWDIALGMDAEPRRGLLRKTFEAVGLVHQAGLVHGRPHLRDMALNDEEIAFFDFEEEPELVMPLADAQARDIWLLMLPVVALDPGIETQRECLQAWLNGAPDAAIRSLIRLLRLSVPLFWIFRFVPVSLRGGDLKRIIAASRFLVASISDMDSVLAKREQSAGSNG